MDKNGNIPKNYYLHALNFKWGNPLITFEAERGFHISAHLGMKRLNPFHDLAIAEFSNRIPPKELMATKFPKGLLRPLASKHLPGLELEKQRKTYLPDHATYTTESLLNQIESAYDLVGVQRIDRLGIVSKIELEKFIPRGKKATLKNSPLVFNCVSSEAWLANLQY